MTSQTPPPEQPASGDPIPPESSRFQPGASDAQDYTAGDSSAADAADREALSTAETADADHSAYVPSAVGDAESTHPDNDDANTSDISPDLIEPQKPEDQTDADLDTKPDSIEPQDSESGTGLDAEPDAIAPRDPNPFESDDVAFAPHDDYVRRRRERPNVLAAGTGAASTVGTGSTSRNTATTTATPTATAKGALLPYGSGRPTLAQLRRKLFSDRHLLLGRTAKDRLWGWLGPALVTLLAFIVRVWNLGFPHKLVFDETHYVKHAWTLLQVGYETEWPKDYDPQFNAGEIYGFEDKAAFIVHPQLGKWLIAIGMRVLGGDNPWGWRIMGVLFGTAAVWLLARAGRRLFGNTKLGVLAGFLFAIDGQGIVMSRTAILDIFLTFFVVAAFATFLVDRDQGRHRLAERAAARLESGQDLSNWGPFLGMRWWRLATAILLGLACGVKLSGIYFVAVWGLLMVIDDALARRVIGVKHWLRAGIIKDGIAAFFTVVPTVIVVYVATWFSWFLNLDSYGRLWATNNPGKGLTWLPDALNSFVHFHQQIWASATGLIYHHPYGAHPAGWIVQLTPTVFWRDTVTDEAATCGADKCIVTIVDVGNPLIWWGATAALVWLFIVWRDRLDWRFVFMLSGLVAGWLPWFLYAKRVVFTFYSIVFAPFVILIVVYMLAQVLERWHFYERRTQRAITVGWVAYGVGVVAVSVFFYPVWIGIQLPHWLWFWHSWLPGWM